MRPALHSRPLVGMLSEHLGDRNLRGVEIGVERGRTSVTLLKMLPGCKLFCVDPWSTMPPDHPTIRWARNCPRRAAKNYLEYAMKSQEEQDRIHAHASRVLARFTGVTILRMTSEQAAPRFQDGTLDFAFIDGDHTRCERDIELYWPKLREGGLLTGHDYDSQLSKLGHWDVNRAVHRHLERYNRSLILGVARLWAIVK